VCGSVAARVAAGALVDHVGPRFSAALFSALAASAVFCTALIRSAGAFVACRLLTGFSLATFVPCQWWTSSMFNARIVGQANAVAAGWGNLGGGATLLLMPLLVEVRGGAPTVLLSQQPAASSALLLVMPPPADPNNPHTRSTPPPTHPHTHTPTHPHTRTPAHPHTRTPAHAHAAGLQPGSAHLPGLAVGPLRPGHHAAGGGGRRADSSG
jgi:MFS family permease